MGFFTTDMINKSADERRTSIIAAINQQIEYLRQKIAYERELAINEETIQDCERKIPHLEELITKISDPLLTFEDVRTTIKQAAIPLMDFDDRHEGYTCQVLIFLAEQKYDTVNTIFDHQQKGFAHDAQSRLVLKNKDITLTKPAQTSSSFWRQPSVQTEQLQKVEDTKKAIESYIKVLQKELYECRFNPFVGYIAKSKLKLFESIAKNIKESHSWEDVRHEVLLTYTLNKKKFHAGHNKQQRAVSLITNILKNRPNQGIVSGKDTLTQDDLSLITPDTNTAGGNTL